MLLCACIVTLALNINTAFIGINIHTHVVYFFPNPKNPDFFVGAEVVPPTVLTVGIVVASGGDMGACLSLVMAGESWLPLRWF